MTDEQIKKKAEIYAKIVSIDGYYSHSLEVAFIHGYKQALEDTKPQIEYCVCPVNYRYTREELSNKCDDCKKPINPPKK